MWLLLPSLRMATIFILHVPAAVCNHDSSNRDTGAPPAHCGPPPPAEGMEPCLVEVRSKNACHPIQGLPDSSSAPACIALLRRNNCSFATKLLHAQQAAHQVAVVPQLNLQSVMTMVVSEAEAKWNVHIPSMINADKAASTLRQLLRSGKLGSVVLAPRHLHVGSNSASQAVCAATSACKCQIRLPGPCLQTVTFPIFWMTCIPVSTLIALLLIEKYLSRCKRWKEVRNQPSRGKRNKQPGFSLPSSKYQECAICLEKYLGYESLKVLSCSHAFHSKCIDLWHLTQARSKTCPLCVQKVILVIRLQTLKLWKEEARSQGRNLKFWPGVAMPGFIQ